MRKNEQSRKDLWDTLLPTHTMGVPEEEEREKWSERIFEEIMVLNFPKLILKV